MANTLDSVASEMVLERVRHSGGTVSTQTEVVGIVGRVGTVAGVITNRQQMIPCQLVLVCTGTRPVTTLAARCTQPMRHKHGIYVDDQLRTSVPDIYAAGDVAALKNPLTGEYEPRAQWYAAVSQGRTAAAMMTEHEELAHQPFGVHWHATHLGELSMLTVGNPLDTVGDIDVLTDTSQGGYRRIAIADDRMVGYLSLGSRQPDSLAIKRIIDEGHPVHDITKALLKGTFDARHYLSQQHTRTAQSMLTRKLPELTFTTPDTTTQEQLYPLAPDTGSLAAAPARQRQTDSLLPIHNDEKDDVDTGKLERQAVASGERKHSTEPLRSAPATTGNTGQRTHVRELPAIAEDEVSPFTGNLPTLPTPSPEPTRIIDSTLVPIPAAKKTTTTRNLWSYDTGKTDTTNTTSNTTAPKKPGRRSSRSIWSYSSKETALERDR